MPLHYVSGDASIPNRVPSTVTVIVHVVNNIFVWGKGFVLSLDKHYPAIKLQYFEYQRTLRKAKAVDYLGDCQLTYDVSLSTPYKTTVVANLFAQHGIRSATNPRPLQYNALRTSLTNLKAELLRREDTFVIHMPRIGCGLAGGKWELVEPILMETVVPSFDVYVYDLPNAR
jgi:O-acetyl-ADP-ribose deacetylase (regulator of RNase III)